MMNVTEAKAKYACRITGVFCTHAERIAFFRQPKPEEFAAVQVMLNDDDADRKLNGQHEYAVATFIGSSAIPTKDKPGPEDYVIEDDDKAADFDRIVKIEGPAIVHTSFARALNDLGGGTAKRTVTF